MNHPTLFETDPVPVLWRGADVLAVGSWSDNAGLIVDVARLGYLNGTVLDATYGEGNFWTRWRPDLLTTNDLYKPADCRSDYVDLPFAARSFDAVVFDPPYRLSGRRDRGDFDHRFGLCDYRSNDEILSDIVAGALECFRVTARHLLVKCQDQVNGGRVRWQTDLISRAIEDVGGHKIDRFDLVSSPRQQHARQQHARRNHSTLLVFTR